MNKMTWRIRKAVCVGLFWGTIALIPDLASRSGPLGHILAAPSLLLGQRALPCLLTAVAMTLALERIGRSADRRARRRRNARWRVQAMP